MGRARSAPMDFKNLVIVAMILTFLPFNEGIIARSPRWQKLSDAIELGVVQAVRWRANANVSAELDLLARHFGLAAVVGMVLFHAVLLIPTFRSPALVYWLAVATMASGFCHLSFRWAFRHSSALDLLTPFVCVLLAIFLLMDFFSDARQLMPALGQISAKLTPELGGSLGDTAIKVMVLLLFTCGLVYAVAWLCLGLFAYAVLLGLKLASRISRLALQRFNRNLLYEISVAVQFFGFVYLSFFDR